MLDGADPRGGVPHRGGARLSPARGAAATTAAAFALFAATLARTVTFGDAGELIAASWRFGIAHPPGYPLYTLLAGAVLHALPFGEPALRTNLLSALCDAAACGVVFLWARQAWDSTAAGFASAGIFATCGIVWSSATETEVYALHALLLAGCLCAASRIAQSPRWLFVAAACLGLGLAHHPTIVLAIPAALMLAWSARPKGKDLAIAAMLVAGIPVALDATLLFRASGDPGAWGGLDSLAKVFAHATANRYRVYDLGWAGLVRGEGWTVVLSTLARSFAWIGVIAAIVGAARPRRQTWALVVLAVAGIAFALRYATEDFASYLIPAAIAVAMLAGRAVTFVTPRRSMPLAILLVGLPLIFNFAANDRRYDRAARLYATDMLATLPTGSVLFTEGDDAFLLAYATEVAGQRSDVTLIDRKQNLFDSVKVYAGPGGELGAIHGWVQGASRRPVFFMSWPGYELPDGWRFDPQGLFFRVVPPDAPPTDDAPLWASYHEDAIVREVSLHPSAFSDSVAATYPLMRAEEDFSRGEHGQAAAALDAADRRAPLNETVLNTIGTTWARRGEIARAEAFFERATAVKPQSVRAWSNLAQARSMLGDVAGAAFATERAALLAEKTR